MDLGEPIRREDIVDKMKANLLRQANVVLMGTKAWEGLYWRGVVPVRRILAEILLGGLNPRKH